MWCLLHFRNTATHKNAHDTIVHVVDHRVKQFHTLEFEDEQRVFLFVRSILHTVLQFVEFAQVFLPALVDDVQQYHLLKLFHYGLALRVVCFLEVARYVIHTASVGQRHHDALVDGTLVFVYLLNDWPSHGLDTFGLTVEVFHHLLEGTLFELVTLLVDELFLCERHFHGENVYELFLATLVIVVFYDIHNAIPESV